MAFGKRQSRGGAVAGAISLAPPAAHQQDASETAAPSGNLFRAILALLFGGGMLYATIVSNAPDVIRDHLLSGTWQPAYDLRAADGMCERTNFIATSCSVEIGSIAQPNRPPIKYQFQMLFVSGGGEPLVPVRSTKDRNAVSIFYAAETKLWNRTLTLLAWSIVWAGVVAMGLTSLWRWLNS